MTCNLSSKIDDNVRADRKYEEAMSELLDKDRRLKMSEEKTLRLGMELHEAITQNKHLKAYIKEEF